MANDFYTHATYPSPNSAGSSANMRAELELITAGFNKLPTLTGNGYKLIGVNATGTALEADPKLTNFDFNTTNVAAGAVGRLTWNDTDGTLDLGLKGGNVTLQLGQEQNVRIYNETAVGFVDMQVVRITGSSGTRLTADLAQANAENTSASTLGIMTEPAASHAEGFATTFGLIRQVNTSAFAEGATLYLSPSTAGGITTTRPTAPNHTVILGWCVRSHATQGSIYVNINNGYELDELHDVLITSVAANNMLRRNSANTVWENIAGPSGAIVGTTDTQTLTNKTFSGGTVTGAVVTGLATPSASSDAATKSYTDTGLALKLNLAGGTMSGAIAMGTNKITGMGDPTAAQDAATKSYVDTLVQGLDPKASVRVATTASITLTGTQTVDGIALSVGDRVLVKDQTASAENGIYLVAASSWTRTTDADTWNELVSAFVFVEVGTTNANNGFTCTVAAGGTLGSTAVTWVQFSGAGQINAGTGLTKSGNTLNVNTASVARIVVNADNIDLATTGVTAGGYSLVTVDTYGRVTGGSNPTTLAGYGITNAYTKSEVDTFVNAKLNLSGGTMTGAIAMGSNKITGLGAPTTDFDAVTLKYVSDLYGSTASAAASAAAALVSQNAAAASASAASTSATNAASSASSASTSATSASGSATSASASAASAAASYDSFDDRYLGPKSTAPALDNDGNPLLTGALYFNTTSNLMWVFDGASWVQAYVPSSTYLPLSGGTMTGGLSGTTLTMSGAVTLSGGTANGVTYLNGSKVLTSGSALTFDGSILNISGNGSFYKNTGYGSSADVSLEIGGTNNGFVNNGTPSAWQLFVGGDANGQSLRFNAFLRGSGYSEQMRLTSTGLGIGTSSPSVKLDVSSTAYPAAKIASSFSFGGNTFTGLQMGASAANQAASIGWVYNPTTPANSFFHITPYGVIEGSVFQINNSGNLGLGVTPSAWQSGFKVIDIGTKAAIFSSGSGQPVVSYNAYYNAGDKYKTSDFASAYQQFNGQHQWYTAPSGTAGNAISFTQAMTLDASNNLLVGGTAQIASERLLVRSAGTARITVASSDSGTAGAAINLLGATTTKNWLIGTSYSIGGALEFIPSTTNGGTTFTTPAMVLDVSGNLLVGTTSTNDTAYGVRFIMGASPAVTCTGAATTNASDSYHLYSTGAGAYRFYVDYSGSIHATSVVISAISDQRLKENVREIDTGLPSIMALKPRRYDWKEGKGLDKKNAAGFIAQEFEEVFPASVGLSKAGEDGIEYKNINYEELIPTLVKAIQEQQALIASLTARLAAAGI